MVGTHAESIVEGVAVIRLWRSEGALVNRAAGRAALRLVALLVAVYLALAMGAGPIRASYPRLIAGPMAWLLNASKDLGPAHQDRISLAASLQHSTRPDALIGWTRHHHLDLQWQPGAQWAYIAGTPANLGSAFEVKIHDYRSRSGQVFYAAAQQ